MKNLSLPTGLSLVFALSKDGALLGGSPKGKKIAGTLCDALPRHFYQFAKRWTERAGWDYYGYQEDSDGSYQDLYAPGNFRANLITLSVRCAF
jgi:hypothetical protein